MKTTQEKIFAVPQTINAYGKLIDISKPLVMAILNTTPDSFYSKSRVNNEEAILKKVEQFLNEGAKIIDIGAYSSRPGAPLISWQEEWQRLEPALKIIKKHYPPTLISIDTFRSEIVERAVEEYGVAIINDISGGNIDTKMFEVVGKYSIPYILMHMKETPLTMQESPNYKHIIQEMISYFSEKKQMLLEQGVKDIILDPGLGFAKTLEHNFEVLARLEEFFMLEMPILIGLSRKSMIYKTLHITPEEALNGTSILNTIALQKGAKILRVHDVKEAIQAIKLCEKIDFFL